MHLTKSVLAWVGLCGYALSSPLGQHKTSSSSSVHARHAKPVWGRQASSGLQALKASITTIQTSVTETNSSVVPFKGGSIQGLLGLIKIDIGVVALGKSIDSTTKIAQNTAVLSTNDSIALGVQFLGLQPKITDLLSRLQTKRSEFDKAGFKILDVRSLIRDDLTTQQTAAGTLGTSLVKVLAPALQPLAAPVNQQIQGNFTTVIIAFQGRGGKIKIPSQAVPTLSNLLADLGKALGIKITSSAAASPQVASPNPATLAPITDTELATSDPTAADEGAQAALDATSDDDLNKLDDNQNDLSGIPLPVLAVLRKYGVI